MKLSNPFFIFFDLLKKLNFFFDKKQRQRIVVLMILLFFGMIFEVASLSMVIPLISSILDPTFLSFLNEIPFISSLIVGRSSKELILAILLVLIIVFLVKTLFLVYLSFRQNKFIGSVIATISNRLFEKYLAANFHFHLNRNTAELMRNLTQEISFFMAFFQAFIVSIVEVVLMVAVVITLVVIEPVGAISLGLFLGIISFAFFQSTKRRLSVWGRERQELDGAISKTILETLSGVKEIKLLNKESFFLNSYAKKNNYKAQINALFTTINLVPRYYLEFMSIFALSSFISIMLFQGKPLETLVTIVGVFVAAIFRLLPSVNKIISSIQVIKYKKYSLDLLLNEFKEVELNVSHQQLERKPLKFKNSISIKNLHFNYEQELPIFDGISLEIKKGEVIGIIGGSGTGKSTLIDILMGLYPEKHENIHVDGNPLQNNIKSLQENIGYVAQDVFLLDNSIKNNIAIGLSDQEIDAHRVEQVIELAQLKAFIQKLPKGIETIVGEKGEQLSGGQRQRIGIARALYHDPEILIFDEATSALDNLTEKEILDVIYAIQNDKTIIMVAHRLSTLARCKKVFEIKNNAIQLTELDLKTI